MNTIKCPRCGESNEAHQTYCLQCNFNLSSKYLKDPVCPKCFSIYLDGDVFCEKDGSKLIAQEELSFRCINCGQTYTDNTKFCPNDGGKVLPYSTSSLQFLSFSTNQETANLGKRFAASLLDGLIGFGFSLPSLICLFMGFQFINHYEAETGVILLICAFFLYMLPIWYFLFKDGFGQGQSWGKKALSLQVLQEETNEPCTKKKSFVRNGVMVLLNFFPFVGAFIEPIVLISSNERKRLGDRAAKTIVIEINQ